MLNILGSECNWQNVGVTVCRPIVLPLDVCRFGVSKLVLTFYLLNLRYHNLMEVSTIYSVCVFIF